MHSRAVFVQLATVDDGETIADAAGLVDSEMAVARPNDETRASGRRFTCGQARYGLIAAGGLGGRKKLLFINRAGFGACRGTTHNAGAEPRGDRREATAGEEANGQRADARGTDYPPDLLTDCTMTLQSA